MNLGIDAHHLQFHDEATRSNGDRQRPMRAEPRDPLPRDHKAPADMTRSTAPDAGADGQSTGSAVAAPLDTHWSRLFYYDYFTSDASDIAPDPDNVTRDDL